MEALRELRRTLAQITSIQESISSAENLAAMHKRYLAEFRVGVDQYGNRTISETLLEPARRAKEVISRELVTHIAEQHQETLRKASRDLEAIRAVLPSMAAKAAIELGVIARQYETEASNND